MWLVSQCSAPAEELPEFFCLYRCYFLMSPVVKLQVCVCVCDTAQHQV